ncbi:MAG: MoxR family ATPase [Chloroflexi bacterium]|nr:MoxR family ATPase [Chloroflexota bacterium]
MIQIEAAATIAGALAANIKRVIVGNQHAVEQGLVALIAGGHLLIEDVPGVGKTTFAKSLAISTGCIFKRIQFVPDLLPSDVMGVNVFNQRSGDFEFRPGPIMAQVVLADEINRAPPKTQAALLEAMEEQQITVDGVTYPLPDPFMVIATLNPIEYQGTFSLPEAQLDRFMARIHLGYASKEEELTIIARQERGHPIEELEAVASPEQVVLLRHAASEVQVEASVRDYIVSLVRTTREHPSVAYGASHRASLALFRAARSLALLRGREYVIPDDVKEMTSPVLAHRLVLTVEARARNIDGRRIIDELLRSLPVPGLPR